MSIHDEELASIGTPANNTYDRRRRCAAVLSGDSKTVVATGSGTTINLRVVSDLDAVTPTVTLSAITATTGMSGNNCLTMAVGSTNDLYLAYTAGTTIRVIHCTLAGNTYTKDWERQVHSGGGLNAMGVLGICVRDSIMVVVALAETNPNLAKVAYSIQDASGLNGVNGNFAIDGWNNSQLATNPNVVGGPLSIGLTSDNVNSEILAVVMARGADYGKTELWTALIDPTTQDFVSGGGWEQENDSLVPDGINLSEAYGEILWYPIFSDSDITVAACTKNYLYIGHLRKTSAVPRGTWVQEMTAKPTSFAGSYPQFHEVFQTRRMAISHGKNSSNPYAVAFHCVRGFSPVGGSPYETVSTCIATCTSPINDITFQGFTFNTVAAKQTLNAAAGAGIYDLQAMAPCASLGRWAFAYYTFPQDGTGTGYLHACHNKVPVEISNGYWKPSNPAHSVTLDTDVFTLTSHFILTALTGFPSQADFRVADNTAFTLPRITSLKTDVAWSSVGLTMKQMSANTGTVNPSQLLFQDTWYIQVREIDALGLEGAFPTPTVANTDYITVTIDHLPTTTGHTPSGDLPVVFDGQVRVDWAFDDTSPIDYQTKYQVQVERVTGAVSLLDTGIVTSTSKFHNVTITAGEKPNQLRWRVRVWDRDDVVGAYSDWHTFYFSDAPVVNVTAPTDPTATPKPAVTWSYTAGTHGVQTHFKVEVKDSVTSAVVYDSGWVAGAGTSHTPPDPILTRNRDYNFTVSVRDAKGFTGSDTNTLVTAAWAGPAQPPFLVTTVNFNTRGYVQIIWNDTNKDANWLSWVVYRRKTGTTTWERVGVSVVPSGSTINMLDNRVPANTSYDYAVVQTKLFDEIEVESDLTTFTTVIPASDSYWLLDPSETGIDNAAWDALADPLSLMLAHVVEDGFDDEYEEVDQVILNRGKVHEVGTHYGYMGSCTAELKGFNGTTGRTERLSLEAIKASKKEYLFRNPFGDIWTVAVGLIHIERISGVGIVEMDIATIPYQEVS